MKKLCKLLKPLATKSIILLVWFLVCVNIYYFFKPLNEYTKSAGLDKIPNFLDEMNYYTPQEGYESLRALGDGGRDAYRIANYTDFVLPVLLFLALSLPMLAMEIGDFYIIPPLVYMVTDYIENCAQKYVLEIYPQRNDFVMTTACYFGLIKIITFYIGVLTLLVFGCIWMCKSKNRSDYSAKTRKLK